jgi:hypothetical protein
MSHSRCRLERSILFAFGVALSACARNEAPPEAAEQCGGVEIGISSLRRLTAVQYTNTIRDLFGISDDPDPAANFSADERVGAFQSNLTGTVGQLQADQYMAAAEVVAARVVADLETLLPCERASAGEDECARQFIAEFAPRAYRRPLRKDEGERLLNLYAAGKALSGFETGIRLVIQGALQSPLFLYHHEFANSDVTEVSATPLNGYELASRLSYFLWGTLPDDALFAVAASGELLKDAGLSAQVDRMLVAPRARSSMASFHLQWLGVDQIQIVEKSPETYPLMTPRLAAAMRDETATFASRVVLDGDSSLKTLLTASYTYTEDSSLLALYGVDLPADHRAGEAVELPAGQRSGLLTHASVMMRHAHADQSSPVARGKLIRENLLCTNLPPPPPEVDVSPPSPDPNATTRQRFEQHRADASCAGCHNLMDGLGFGFEHYDGIGAWREREGDVRVDASGWIAGTDFDGNFDGAGELGGLLADSPLVAECVARQWFRFALGRAEAAEDEMAVQTLGSAFLQSGQDIRVLLRRLVLSASFRCGRAQEQKR